MFSRLLCLFSRPCRFPRPRGQHDFAWSFQKRAHKYYNFFCWTTSMHATLGSGARQRRTRCGRALEARYLRRAFPRRAAYCWEPQTSLLCIESTEESHDSSIPVLNVAARRQRGLRS